MPRSVFRSRFTGNRPDAEAESGPEAAVDTSGFDSQVQAEEPAPEPSEDMMTDPDLHEPHAATPAPAEGRPRAPLWIAGVLSLLWLSAAAAGIYVFYQAQGATKPSLIELAVFAAGATAPLSIIWIVAFAFLLRTQTPGARIHLREALLAERRLRRAAERLNGSVSAFDGALAVVENRADALSAGIDRQITNLVGTVGQINGSAEAAERRLSSTVAMVSNAGESLFAAAARVADVAEEAGQKVSSLPAVLDPLAGRIDGLAEKLQNSGSVSHDLAESLSRAINQLVLRQRDLNASLSVTDKTAADILARIEAANANLGDQAEALDKRAQSLVQQIGDSSAHISATADELVERITGVSGASQEAMRQQVEALGATLDGLRARLAAATNEAMTDLARQADQAGLDLSSLMERFAAQRQATANEIGRLQEAWRSVEAQIAAGLTNQEQGISDIQQRLRSLTDEARALPQSIADGMTAADQMQTALADTQREAARLTQSLAATIEQANEARATVTAAAEQSNAMAGGIQSFSDGAAHLGETLNSAMATLDRQRNELEELHDVLTRTLAELAPALAAARDATQATALQSSAHLVDTLARVRSMTAQAGEALKDAADEIIQTAQSTLRRMNVESIRDELVTPLRETITEVESASRRGVEATRVAVGQLHNEVNRLNDLAASIEKRVAETDEYLENVAEQDLSRTASLLIESLNSSAIDIAKMLGTDVSDTDWQAYIRGDRSIFVRRAVKLADRGERTQISRLFETDNEFRDQVRRYIRDFERLIGRTMAERDGHPLSVTLLSSDLGKLYVVLAQSINRLGG